MTRKERIIDIPKHGIRAVDPPGRVIRPVRANWNAEPQRSGDYRIATSCARGCRSHTMSLFLVAVRHLFWLYCG